MNVRHYGRRQWLVVAVFLTCLPLLEPTFAGLGVSAEELTPTQQRAVDEAVRKYLEHQGVPEGGGTQVPPPPGAADESSSKSLEQLGKPRSGSHDSTMEGSGSLVYARPFVSSPKAIVGGYMDIEYTNRANRGKPSLFDLHRLVPFIYGDVSERLKFAAEIELEHGNELGIEFATMDYLVNEPVNFRAGLLLLPLGKFNLLHDSPLRDLTERPLINQRIIPTTFRQAGAGIYGTLYPSRLSQLNYELYVTSGFTNAFGGGSNPSMASSINNLNGIRSARSSNTSFDNNNGKAVVGRLAVSPFLGVEVGGSGFFGAYDPPSKRPLAIWAIDGTMQRGPFELIGEAAWAYIRDNHLNANGTLISSGGINQNARRMNGYYVQANYHFLPQWLSEMAPQFFRQDISTFTAVVRWEAMNLADDLDNLNFGPTARELALRGSRQRLTLGLNFRPTEDTVLKFDFQYSPEEVSDGHTFTGAAQPSVTPGDGGRSRIHDTAFLASWATYF